MLVTAAVALGARTWHVGAGLGTALFPVDGIVELAAVGTGTVAAGWVGGHALVALCWVLAHRTGVRWAAGERAVSRHAPAVVRRLARAAVGAGIGLALAAPTATALPERGAATDADGGPAVVVDLGWEPTGRTAEPERSTLVNRGLRAGTERAPVVVVQPGDTLWAIAADSLATERASADPSDAEVAAAVERWHHVNRQAVGANPDLIRPGTVLRRP